MKIYIDIDQTICETKGSYSSATPKYDVIKKSNDLYDAGHEITYWTARGAVTGIDWTELTKNQLESWGVKYHNLRLDKPSYDVFIDDKNINWTQSSVENILNYP